MPVRVPLVPSQPTTHNTHKTTRKRGNWRTKGNRNNSEQQRTRGAESQWWWPVSVILMVLSLCTSIKLVQVFHCSPGVIVRFNILFVCLSSCVVVVVFCVSTRCNGLILLCEMVSLRVDYSPLGVSPRPVNPPQPKPTTHHQPTKGLSPSLFCPPCKHLQTTQQ